MYIRMVCMQLNIRQDSYQFCKLQTSIKKILSFQLLLYVAMFLGTVKYVDLLKIFSSFMEEIVVSYVMALILFLCCLRSSAKNNSENESEFERILCLIQRFKKI